MSKTLQIQLSDASIKKHAADQRVVELKDPRHPLRFRYRKDRARGSWYVVRYDRGGRWKKAGNWPDVPARLMLDSLPGVMARLTVDPASAATVDGWETVAELLEWFAARVELDRGLTRTRRATTLSAIRCHLLPRLGALRLDALDKARIDDRLIWPMKAECGLSHIKSVFGVLQNAFRRALRLSKIRINPIERVTFGDFSKEKIRPKGARLRHVEVVDLLAVWADQYDSKPVDVTFAAMMLAHGSRISETRLAKWKDLSLSAGGEWFIPAAHTKSRRDHRIPLTTQAIAILTRYRNQQKAKGYAGAYLFPSPKQPGKPLSRGQSFEIFRRLGNGEWSSHDLRKLSRTTWADLNVDSLVAKLLLNHALTDLEATYFQSQGEALKRAALDKWHSWLDTQGFDALHSKTAARRAAKPVSLDPSGWLA
jgi:integrase